MLVLSRQRDETIMIGDSIEVIVVDIRGDKVRLGIRAPQDIPVHRKEIYDAIQRENREAAKLKSEGSDKKSISHNPLHALIHDYHGYNPIPSFDFVYHAII